MQSSCSVSGTHQFSNETWQRSLETVVAHCQQAQLGVVRHHDRKVADLIGGHNQLLEADEGRERVRKFLEAIVRN